MILGRSPALWLAGFVAVLNVAVVVLGVRLDSQQIAALDAAAVAIIGIIANESDPTTAGTFAATTKAPAAPAPAVPETPPFPGAKG